MGKPEVSVVMPVRNGIRFIFDAVDSVVKQGFSEWELLIIDDGSSDGTLELVRDIEARDPRLRILQTQGSEGPAVARNVGLAAARGRFVAFLDSDDIWAPAKLQMQLDVMKSTECAFTYTRFDIIDEDGAAAVASANLPVIATYGSLLTYCFIRTSSVVVDRRVLGDVVFPLVLKRQDFGFFLAALKATPYAKLVDETLCSYRIGHSSVSSNKYRNIKFQWQIYRHVEAISTGRSLYLMAAWFTRSGSTFLRRLNARRRSRSRSRPEAGAA